MSGRLLEHIAMKIMNFAAYTASSMNLLELGYVTKNKMSTRWMKLYPFEVSETDYTTPGE
jgi:hypothetical protein